MSPLAKEIIEKLNKEKDSRVLGEVLDFYEYLKQKKDKELQKKWADIDEDEATEDEKKSYQQYKNLNEQVIPLENLMKELNLDEQ
ncbi:hypothetical protein LGK97_01850 [Clostridium sp. CS001]|uniref:hypothetical protein n=1 Tax=Clostridium sp. CS001 TaxID=2880648 RepID=UPI001CF29F05|nr:hypothetical protein [Clostridium sp. CS001]MCB2288510.1 hypothetical protein [Clostridium sp. CS001]